MFDEIKDIGNSPLPVDIGDAVSPSSARPFDKPTQTVQPAFVVELDREDWVARVSIYDSI